jgi:hypothetical protein
MVIGKDVLYKVRVCAIGKIDKYIANGGGE